MKHGHEGISRELKGMGSLVGHAQGKPPWSQNWGLISGTPQSHQDLWDKGLKGV